MKKYRKVIKSIIATLVIISVLQYMGIINFNNLSELENAGICWNIITINSVFAGFMFTSLSILISVMFSDTVKMLERAALMDEIYKNILCGIYCSLLSIAFSLVTIFITPNILAYLITQESSIYSNIFTFFMVKFIPLMIMYTLILSILCFLGSVLDVRFIIKDLRKRINKSSVSQESRQNILKNIK